MLILIVVGFLVVIWIVCGVVACFQGKAALEIAGIISVLAGIALLLIISSDRIDLKSGSKTLPEIIQPK